MGDRLTPSPAPASYIDNADPCNYTPDVGLMMLTGNHMRTASSSSSLSASNSAAAVANSELENIREEDTTTFKRKSTINQSEQQAEVSGTRSDPSSMPSMSPNPLFIPLGSPYPSPDSATPSSTTSSITSSSSSVAVAPCPVPISLSSLEASKSINSRKLSPSDFIFGRMLGEGSFARVVEATLITDENGNKLQEGTAHPNALKYACKIVDKHFITKMGKAHTVVNEKKILTILHGHVGIIKLYYTFQDTSSLYYVMELATGGEMYEDLKKYGRYDIGTIRVYSAELLEILFEMHSKYVIHRDLKPENILMDEKHHLKVTDFGTAKDCNEDMNGDGDQGADGKKKRRPSFAGTAEYVSPEVLQDKPATYESDLWSYGCILYQMYTGRVPFKGLSEYLTFQKILKGEIKWPSSSSSSSSTSVPSSQQQQSPTDQPASSPSSSDSQPPIVSDPPLSLDESNLRDLISKLLVVDPQGRLGASEVSNGYQSIKSHPFFPTANPPIRWGNELFEQPVPPRPEPVEIEQEVPETHGYSFNDDYDDDDDGGDHFSAADHEGNASDEESELAAKMAELSAAEVASKVAQQTASSASTASNNQPQPITIAQTTAASASSSSSSSSTPAAPSKGHAHKYSTDGQYSNSVWSKFLLPNTCEKILYTGIVIKRRALYARKRQLILTDTPRLFYVDPDSMKFKKEIPWDPKLWAEVVDPLTFYIHVVRKKRCAHIYLFVHICNNFFIHLLIPFLLS